MQKSPAQKMRIKPASRAYFKNAPEDVVTAMDLPALDMAQRLTGEFDYIHLFVKTQNVMREHFPKLTEHLKLGGTLWVSWPKNKQLGTGLTLPKVIEIGYDFGLVESTALSIDATWSALKFTHPKEGKVYNNSYGKLKV